MLRSILMAGAAAIVVAQDVAAQQIAADGVFIQIEAQPSLTEAETSLRDYAARLQNVNGFSMNGGWYGIALGPYDPLTATTMLRDLRRTGQIPPDSYLVAPDVYGRQFWPVGGSVTQPVTVPEQGVLADPQLQAAPETTAEPAPAPVVDESPREARASEAALDGNQRMALQIALEWAGVYHSSIDGAFGRGTRNAMAQWQGENGYEPTGILTTRQRADLLGQYNAILDGLDMTLVADDRAGIAVEMPLGAVAFDSYESPFAIYEPSGDLAARVLLISQPGDRQALWGLYEIMQTLEIVPLEGERSRSRDGFVLTGANSRIVSHTEATLVDGQIKGWTLVWPAGDEERRTRVLNLMKTSFRRTDGVLDPAAVSDEGQTVDLMSGLKIRQPEANVAGFFVDRSGAVLTSAAAVQSCGRITLDGSYDARVVAMDETLGVAVLKPLSSLAPRGVASFRSDLPRLKSEIAVSGYPFGGVLSAPTLTYGTLEDGQGLGGEPEIARLALASAPGDAGGPVLDAGGSVLGMMLPRESGAQTLPEDVSFAADAEALTAFLRGAGMQGLSSQAGSALAPEDLTAAAMGMTVLVSCWE